MKLTKEQAATRARYAEAFNDAQSTLAEQITAYNTAIAEQYALLNEAANTFNEARQTFINGLEELAAELQLAFDEKTERWQESDAGTSAQEWIERYSSADGELEDYYHTAPDDAERDEQSPDDIAPEESE